MRTAGTTRSTSTRPTLPDAERGAPTAPPASIPGPAIQEQLRADSFSSRQTGGRDPREFPPQDSSSEMLPGPRRETWRKEAIEHLRWRKRREQNEWAQVANRALVTARMKVAAP